MLKFFLAEGEGRGGGVEGGRACENDFQTCTSVMQLPKRTCLKIGFLCTLETLEDWNTWLSQIDSLINDGGLGNYHLRNNPGPRKKLCNPSTIQSLA